MINYLILGLNIYRKRKKLIKKKIKYFFHKISKMRDGGKAFSLLRMKQRKEKEMKRRISKEIMIVIIKSKLFLINN